MTRSLRPFLLIAPAAALIGVFLLLPYLNIVVMSFRRPATGTPYGQGFSLDGYARFFSDAYYLSALGQTLWLGALTTLVCLVLGFPVAFQLARSARAGAGRSTASCCLRCWSASSCAATAGPSCSATTASSIARCARPG